MKPANLPKQFSHAVFRRHLLAWYAAAQRSLPWRASRDPYRIWISEVMLQQTRVAAVLPYYERFVARFPTVSDLAAADITEVLLYWAGLGYYSRARNLHAAARLIAERGSFPSTYEEIRALPGVGDYTAAAVASIAFQLPYAVLDGNVARVLARISAEPGNVRAGPIRERLLAFAGELLDRRDPGGFNQALMELGATICVPKTPQCSSCPVLLQCAARAQGLEKELPILASKPASTSTAVRLLIIARSDEVLLRPAPEDSVRLAGLWHLPDTALLPDAKILQEIARFRHTIVRTKYECRVAVADLDGGLAPSGFVWVPMDNLNGLPLSTTARKALAFYGKRPHRTI
jgi:A/G-specific adenine glycosylase